MDTRPHASLGTASRMTLLTGDREILDRDMPCSVEDLRGDRA